MIIKNLIDEDFINYKTPSMFIITSKCNFKCERECGIIGICQNHSISKLSNINIPNQLIVKRYLSNNITKSIIIGGLEPFDQFDEVLDLILKFRENTSDPIIIYTGYYKSEIEDQIQHLKELSNIIIKFGRFIPNRPHHIDPILGVELASPNQYAEKIS